MTFVEFVGKYSIYQITSKYLLEPVYGVYFEYIDSTGDKFTNVQVKLNKHNFSTLQQAKEFVEYNLFQKDEELEPLLCKKCFDLGCNGDC